MFEREAYSMGGDIAVMSGDNENFRLPVVARSSRPLLVARAGHVPSILV